MFPFLFFSPRVYISYSVILLQSVQSVSICGGEDRGYRIINSV